MAKNNKSPEPQEKPVQKKPQKLSEPSKTISDDDLKRIMEKMAIESPERLADIIKLWLSEGE